MHIHVCCGTVAKIDIHTCLFSTHENHRMNPFDSRARVFYQLKYTRARTHTHMHIHPSMCTSCYSMDFLKFLVCIWMCGVAFRKRSDALPHTRMSHIFHRFCIHFGCYINSMAFFPYSLPIPISLYHIRRVFCCYISWAPYTLLLVCIYRGYERLLML